MTWTVLFHDAFDTEFEALVEDLQDELKVGQISAGFTSAYSWWPMRVTTII
jgi:hypothetical protein